MIPMDVRSSLFKGKDSIIIEKRMIETQAEEIKPVLGISLNELALNKDGIPYILLVLVSYFYVKNQALKHEGIFRVSGSVTEEEEMENALRKKNYNYIYSIQNPNIVAGTIKKFFRLLPEPLFSFDCYYLIGDFKGNIRNISSNFYDYLYLNNKIKKMLKIKF